MKQEKLYTVIELIDKTGWNRGKIYYRLKNNDDLKKHVVTNEAGTMTLTESGFDILMDQVKEESYDDIGVSEDKDYNIELIEKHKDIERLSEKIDLLERELEKRESYLQNNDDYIRELIETNKNNQVLMLQYTQKIEKLEHDLSNTRLELENTSNVNYKTSEDKEIDVKETWFSRVFKKK